MFGEKKGAAPAGVGTPHANEIATAIHCKPRAGGAGASLRRTHPGGSGRWILEIRRISIHSSLRRGRSGSVEMRTGALARKPHQRPRNGSMPRANNR